MAEHLPENWHNWGMFRGPSSCHRKDVEQKLCLEETFMPVAGGGGMAAYSMGELALGVLFWGMAFALGLLVAGTILLWFPHRLQRVSSGEMANLSERLTRLEYRIERYLQLTGGYQEWAKMRDRDRNEDA